MTVPQALLCSTGLLTHVMGMVVSCCLFWHLAGYLCGFRSHQRFHSQLVPLKYGCVENMGLDILTGEDGWSKKCLQSSRDSAEHHCGSGLFGNSGRLTYCFLFVHSSLAFWTDSHVWCDLQIILLGNWGLAPLLTLQGKLETVCFFLQLWGLFSWSHVCKTNYLKRYNQIAVSCWCSFLVILKS